MNQPSTIAEVSNRAAVLDVQTTTVQTATETFTLNNSCQQCGIETQTDHCKECQQKNKIILYKRIFLPSSVVLGFGVCISFFEPVTSIGIGLTIGTVVSSFIDIIYG